MAASAPSAYRMDHAAEAARLREAYNGRAVPPLRLAQQNATIADAYAIQAINTDFWLAQGKRRVGAKIGLTARSVQAQLGVDQPDFGVLRDDMRIDDGGVASMARLLQPKVEAEIAFTLAHTPETSTMRALADSVRFAQPAIEIVDSRIENWNIGIVDTVADNASSGLFVLGPKHVPLNDIDLRLCGMVLEKNGEPVSFGAGAACLGNPLHALRWLADTMASYGQPLRKGDVVLAGALGPMVPAMAGDAFKAEIAGLGAVNVRFEA